MYFDLPTLARAKREPSLLTWALAAEQRGAHKPSCNDQIFILSQEYKIWTERQPMRLYVDD